MNKNFNVSALSFKKALEKVGDGSGGGSTSKYKQPEWGAETAIVDILPETTFEATEDMDGMAPVMESLPYTLVGGNTYEVIYNGTSYSCVCLDEDNGNDGGTLCLGNAAATGIEAPVSDEPFVFVMFYGSALDDMGVPGIAMPLDGSVTFTLSIKGESGEIHKIPAEYAEQVPYAPLIVTFPGLSDGDRMPHPGYLEIKKAIDSGRNVYMDYGDFRLRFAGYNLESIIFEHITYQSDALNVLRITVDNGTVPNFLIERYVMDKMGD